MNRTFQLMASFLVLLISFYSVGQESERTFNGDENYLRACIQWNDSTEYQTPIYTRENRTIYKFKLRSLYWGVYHESEIYVATYKPNLNKFNPERKLGRDYFWTLGKTEHTLNGNPVYVHRGNF